MVGATGQKSDWVTNPSFKSLDAHRIRYINQGLGGSIKKQARTSGVWSAEESANHMELLAAFLAIKAFAKTWKDVTVLIRMDNFTAVTYINRRGDTCSQKLCYLAILVWEWCLERNIMLLAKHLLGQFNTAADTESRTVRDCCDWMLNPAVFQRTVTQMGPLEIDLFAPDCPNNFLVSTAEGLIQRPKLQMPSCRTGPGYRILPTHLGASYHIAGIYRLVIL